MAVTSGTVHSVDTLVSDSVDTLQVARVLFTMSGTYAQADKSKLAAVATLIQNSRRNGKTVTLVDVMRGTHATKASDPSAILSMSSVAISTADVTFAITDGDETTEYADATAIPAQQRPFCIFVAFTEA